MSQLDLKGVAQNKKSPKVPKYLKKIGFEIIGTPSQKNSLTESVESWGNSIDPILRHPFVLVLLSSLLTLVVGSWLTATYQERQREREATVKSMDELRGAIDDVSLAFNQYSLAATNLVELKEHGSPPDKIAAAQIAYEDAYNNWHLKYLADEPNIRERMPGNRGGDATVLMLTEAYLGSIAVDVCIGTGKIDSTAPNAAQRGMRCAFRLKGHADLTAEERINGLTGCVEWFHMFVRPDPKNDFDSEAQIQARLGSALMQMNKACMSAI
jgi:hypothetical protein